MSSATSQPLSSVSDLPASRRMGPRDAGSSAAARQRGPRRHWRGYPGCWRRKRRRGRRTPYWSAPGGGAACPAAGPRGSCRYCTAGRRTWTSAPCPRYRAAGSLSEQTGEPAVMVAPTYWFLKGRFLRTCVANFIPSSDPMEMKTKVKYGTRNSLLLERYKWN